MTESAVRASASLLRSICRRKDERVQVQPMSSPPYRWICSLTIESTTGRRYVGSGFLINLPDVDRTAIVTSGHCTYVNGHYAAKITVTFPGQGPIEVRSNDLYASPEYINTGSADYDYGLILFPGPGASDDGFGWSVIVNDEELDNRLVTNCGFPADKPRGTMWVTGGNISSYTANRIFYMNDTMGGQSGSPVYTWYGGYWTVIGVHSYGGCPNSAPRLTLEMISRFLERMNCLKIKSLRSVAFPGVYVRCDGTGVTESIGPGGGAVNCQYKPPGSYEGFYIHPVEITPSLAVKSTCKVVIESAHFRNVFISLDSRGMSQPDSIGGGEVNCQSYPGPYEKYIFTEEENKSYSFRSIQFPHCYIRLDGSGVTSWSGSGGGTVNCQWYEFSSTPRPQSYEIFHVEEIPGEHLTAMNTVPSAPRSATCNLF